MNTVIRSNGRGADALIELKRFNGPEKISQTLMEKLARVGIESFGKGMKAPEVRQHVRESDTIFVAFKNNGVAGFACSVYLLSQFGKELYLSGSAVREADQGNGVYRMLTEARIDLGIELGARAIATRTQNPRIEKVVSEVINAKIIDGTVMLGDQKAKRQRATGFTVVRDQMPGVYGRRLTADVPLCGDSRLDSSYAELDYNRGDAFMLTFVLAPAASKQAKRGDKGSRAPPMAYA